MGPGKTSTAHGCLVRQEGCGWPVTTTTNKKNIAHSNICYCFFVFFKRSHFFIFCMFFIFCIFLCMIFFTFSCFLHFLHFCAFFYFSLFLHTFFIVCAFFTFFAKFLHTFFIFFVCIMFCIFFSFFAFFAFLHFLHFKLFLHFWVKSMLSSGPTLLSAFNQRYPVGLRCLLTLCVERTCVPWSHVAQH